MSDKIKFQVSYVDSANGKKLYSVVTKPVSVRNSASFLVPYLHDYLGHLCQRPYTKLIISPLVSVETGELFNLKNDFKNG